MKTSLASNNFLLEKIDHCVVITINNPPANTWTLDSLLELEQIVLSLNSDNNNYSLIIHSSSEKFFSAGADLNLVNHRDQAKAQQFTEAFAKAFQALSHYRGVSIAAITGYALGGGLEAALCCDIRICEQQAQMALPEAAVGLLPCGLGSQHLPWLVGEAWAKRMMLLGERIDAEKAKQIGLVQEIVATGSSLEQAFTLAAMAAKQSPIAARYCKELIMEARNSDMNKAFIKEQKLFVKLWETEDQQEGVSAFLEKRRPHWKNK